MLSQAEAIIYLADKRDCYKTDQYRSYQTFNFRGLATPGKNPVGKILAFNDEALAGKSSTSFQVETDTAVLLIPVIGSLHLKSKSGVQFVEAGQSHLFFPGEGDEFEITNPFEENLINFIHIWLQTGTQRFTIYGNEFNLTQHKNQLVPILPKGSFKNEVGYIGKYDGREEGLYTLKNPAAHIFAFVIEGVVEVENRLLHARDGLALWNTETVTFEALSKEAIILLLEQ